MCTGDCIYMDGYNYVGRDVEKHCSTFYFFLEKGGGYWDLSWFFFFKTKEYQLN